MVNKYIGEVPLVVGDKTYTMRLTTKEIINVERHFGVGWNKCVKRLEVGEEIKIDDLCAFLKSSLCNAHSDLTEDDVCEIVTEVGIETVVTKLAEAMKSAMPKREAAEGNTRPT